MRIRRASRDERWVAALWAIAAASAVALRGFAPFAAARLPECALHALTGMPCPACGSTRAALALARGEWLQAVSWNPLVATALAVFVLGAVAVPAWALAGAPLPNASGLSIRALRVTTFALLLGNWLFLIARGV